MTSKFTKGIFLGLLLVLCMSVAVAADVSDDTISDVVSDVETLEDTTEVDSTDCNCGCGCSSDATIPTIDVTTAETVTVNNTTNLTINSNKKYDFTGTFINRNITYDNLSNVILTSSNNDATFINSTITLSGTNIKVSNLKFDNTNTNGNPLTITDSTNVVIDNNQFKVYKNTQTETYSINVINSANVVITNNQLNMSGAPQGVNWSAGGVVEYSGIVFSNVNDSYIDSNVLTLTNSTPAVMWDYSTMEAITVRSASQNDVIRRNNIDITGSDYIYGISTSELSNNLRICLNNVTMTGTNLVSGIQLSSTTNSKVCSNKIEGTCTAASGNTTSGEAFAYGITVLTYTWHPPASEATGNVICNNTITLDSTVAYAIELSIADNTIIRKNTATVTGNVVMALGIYNSSYNSIIDNTFTVTGNTTTLNSGIYEAVYPVTTGIKIVDDGFNNTQNNTIIGNTINVTDTNSASLNDIILEGTNNTIITENYMTLIPRVGFRIQETGCSNTSITNNYGLP